MHSNLVAQPMFQRFRWFINILFIVPEDGGWGSWSSWSSCSVSCGNGTNTRTRRCDNPEPSGGGVDCPGAVNQTEYCNHGECPGM